MWKHGLILCLDFFHFCSFKLNCFLFFFFNSIYAHMVNADITCKPGLFGIFPCFKYKKMSSQLIFSHLKKDQLHYYSVFLQMLKCMCIRIHMLCSFDHYSKDIANKKNISMLVLLWVVSLFIYVALIKPLKLLCIFQTSVRRLCYLL